MKSFQFHLSTLCICTIVMGVLIYPLVWFFSSFGNQWECLGQYKIVTADGRRRTVEFIQLVPRTIPGDGFRIRAWAGCQVVYDSAGPFRFGGVDEIRVSSDERRLYLYTLNPIADVMVLEERQGRLCRSSTTPREAEGLLAQCACVAQLSRWTNKSRDDPFYEYAEGFRHDAIRRLSFFDHLESSTIEVLRKVVKEDPSASVRLAATQLLASRISQDPDNLR